MWLIFTQFWGAGGKEFHLQAFSLLENSPVIFTEQVTSLSVPRETKSLFRHTSNDQAIDSETELRVLGRI